MTKIIILGTGGNCIDILETLAEINARRSGSYDCLGYLDDDEALWETDIHGARVLGPLSAAREYPDAQFVNGIGSPANFWRKPSIIAKTGLPDSRFERIVHPTASVSPSARLGPGTVVMQQVTVASNVRVGAHVIVLPNSVLSHDDLIGDFTCIAGGVCISGGVSIGESCYLGTNASIIGNVTIGRRCLIGMGSVVLDSVPDNQAVVGNPARFLRTVGDGR